MPSTPDITYKDGGWQGWGHWFGTGNQSSEAKGAPFLPLDEALRVARQLRLVSYKDWQLWCRSSGHEHWLCHADVGTELSPDATRPAGKRAAPGHAGATSGQGGCKRRRR